MEDASKDKTQNCQCFCSGDFNISEDIEDTTLKQFTYFLDFNVTRLKVDFKIVSVFVPEISVYPKT